MSYGAGAVCMYPKISDVQEASSSEVYTQNILYFLISVFRSTAETVELYVSLHFDYLKENNYQCFLLMNQNQIKFILMNQ